MAIHRITFDSKEEWLKHRTRIGGSDAAAILGLSHWKTNVQAWEEKTGRRTAPDISGNEAVKYGVAAEPLLRDLFALDFPEYTVEYFGDNMILNDDLPFGAASLDGELIEKETGRKGILEIKTTEITRAGQKELWKGRIPDWYYPQLLHYFMITGYEFAVMTAQLKFNIDGEVFKQTKHYHLERSEIQEDIEFLKEKELEFWQLVQQDKKPALILPHL